MEQKVSVVIPVYNVENVLRRCINSVINQSYRNIEVILIDDGSTDASGIICDEYALMDKRIKVIHIPNGGVSNARNQGIAMANGDFLKMLQVNMYFLLIATMRYCHDMWNLSLITVSIKINVY